MNHINIMIEGIPKAQPRVKAYSKGGRAGVYDPGTADSWKMQIALALKEDHGLMLDGPLELEVDFCLPRPKRLCRAKDPDEPIPHTSKPDCDNLVKAVMDVMSNCLIWGDDKQVYSIRVKKYYAGKDLKTGMVLKLYSKEE